MDNSDSPDDVQESQPHEGELFKRCEVAEYELNWKIDPPYLYILNSYSEDMIGLLRENRDSGLFPVENEAGRPCKWRATAYFCGFNQSICIRLHLADREKPKRLTVNVTSSVLKADGYHFGELTEWCVLEPSKLTCYYTRTISYKDLTEKSELLPPNGIMTLHIMVRTYGFRAYNKKVAGDKPDRQNRTFICAEGSSFKFEVDRSIIIKSSPVFEMMLTYDCRESRENLIKIRTLDAIAMEMLIVFVHSGRLILDLLYNISSDQLFRCEILLQLFSAADLYQLEGLKLQCEDALSSFCEIESICLILTVATRLSNDRLAEYAATNIKGYGCRFYRSDSWIKFKQNHPQTALDILRKLLSKGYACTYEEIKKKREKSAKQKKESLRHTGEQSNGTQNVSGQNVVRSRPNFLH